MGGKLPPIWMLGPLPLPPPSQLQCVLLVYAEEFVSFYDETYHFVVLVAAAAQLN